MLFRLSAKLYIFFLFITFLQKNTHQTIFQCSFSMNPFKLFYGSEKLFNFINVKFLIFNLSPSFWRFSSSSSIAIPALILLQKRGIIQKTYKILTMKKFKRVQSTLPLLINYSQIIFLPL